MMLTASRDTLQIIQKELHKYAEMVADENMSVIHIIGSLISYGGSDHCFTLSVHSTDKNKLISSLSKQFLESQCVA